jgi:signal transduction histidine kinase
MTAVLDQFAKHYNTALQHYLKKPREAGLEEAYELGRKAVVDGLGLLDVTKVHQEAIEAQLLRGDTKQENVRIVRAAQIFLTESLSPFEMTHRGFRDANRTLQELNETLERRATELAAANRELQNEISERKQAEASLRQLSGRLLELQDEERRRMARELHDTTGQTLVALSVNISLVNNSATQLDKRAAKALLEALALAEECSREIRTFSYLLHPPMLDELGLAAALRWYTDGFSRRSGIHVDLDVPAKIARMPREAEMTLFRIVQESLTNIHRHSESSTVRIRVAVESGEVELEVKDNGRGIPKGKLEESGGISSLGVGIAGMRERVRQLGGQLEIQSSKRGTTVRAILPIAVKDTATV